MTIVVITPKKIQRLQLFSFLDEEDIIIKRFLNESNFLNIKFNNKYQFYSTNNIVNNYSIIIN